MIGRKQIYIIMLNNAAVFTSMGKAYEALIIILNSNPWRQTYTTPLKNQTKEKRFGGKLSVLRESNSKTFQLLMLQYKKVRVESYYTSEDESEIQEQLEHYSKQESKCSPKT